MMYEVCIGCLKGQNMFEKCLEMVWNGFENDMILMKVICHGDGDR